MYETKTITIDQKTVDDFCQLVNDTNQIHKSNYENPIIPGMLSTSLIFEKPGDFWRLAKMEVKYTAPILVGIPIVYEYILIAERTILKKYKVLISQNSTVCSEAEITLVRKT